MRFPSEVATLALDYRIDRPIVAAVRVDPPVLAHGLPVTIDALVLAPPGVDAPVTEVAICGLRDDLIVEVDADDCFNEPDLVDVIGDGVPAAWDPPDLSAIDCPYEYYGYDGYAPDTGYRPDDTADTAAPPRWDTGPCASHFPLLVRADGPDGPAYGRVHAFLRTAPYREGEFVPTAVHALPRELTWSGDAVAGGTIELELRVAANIDAEGFRWWIDAGELLGTGRTAVHFREDAWWITRNTLRVPDDFHGDLRVFVVAESAISDATPYTADLTWEGVTIPVP